MALRDLALTVGVGGILALLVSCDTPGTPPAANPPPDSQPPPNSQPPPGSQEPPDSQERCVLSYFMANGQYSASNGAMGPPFPFVRHVFCITEDEDTVTYSFEMGDARKTVHAVFGLEFSDFETTEEGATATYERSTIEVKTDFAEQNALSKWVTCRDKIRSRQKFTIDGCFEVDGDSIMRIGPGHPDVDETRFPCGINVGPEGVLKHTGDEVPPSIYPEEDRGPLVTTFMRGDRMDLHTDDRIEGIYVPGIFFQGQTFDTELAPCGKAP